MGHATEVLWAFFYTYIIAHAPFCGVYLIGVVFSCMDECCVEYVRC